MYDQKRITAIREDQNQPLVQSQSDIGWLLALVESQQKELAALKQVPEGLLLTDAEIGAAFVNRPCSTDLEEALWQHRRYIALAQLAKVLPTIMALQERIKVLKTLIINHHAAGKRIAGQECEYCPPGFWQKESDHA